MALKIKKPVGGKPGNGGYEDTLIVQKLLNCHISNIGYPKLKEDGDPGKNTVSNIKYFQKVTCFEIKADGKVEPGKNTLSSLNMSNKELAAYLKGMSSSDGGDAASSVVVWLGKQSYEFTSQNEADRFLDTVTKIVIRGKTHYFIGKEWDIFLNDMCKTLSRTVVVGARQRADSAKVLWEHFKELNDDQYIVSWFVSLAGPDLPKKLINNAQTAARDLESAVKSRNFARIETAIRNAEYPINKAYRKMKQYRKDVIGTAGGYVTALEVTKTTSFIIVGAIAAPMVATAAGTGAAMTAAIVSGGTGLVGSTTNELGKYAVGTSGGAGDAIENIAITTVVDATVEAVIKSKRGEELMKGIGSGLAKATTSKWLGKVSGKTAEKYIALYISNAGEAGVEEAIKQSGKMIKGKTKPKDFIGNVTNAMITGGFMKSFDKAIDDKYAQSIYDSISKKTRDEIFGKVKSAAAVKMIQESIKNQADKIAGASLDAALASASGKESPKALAEAAARKLAKGSSFKKFQQILEAKAAKHGK